MARGASITVENSFNRGLITEFTAMNFPEQAVTDADNVVFTEFGEIRRRHGMDIEPEGITNSGYADSTVTEYEWFSVGNDGAVRIVVQQIGGTIWFYTVSDSGALSRNRRPFSIGIGAYRTAGTSDDEIVGNECRYTTGRGYLFVTHPFTQPFFVEYNPDTDSITVTAINLETRDLVGVEDGLEIDFNPTTLSNEHHYNLLNQGWYFGYRGLSVLTRWQGNGESEAGPRTDYPSNADIWWLNKRGSVGDEYLGNPGEEIFDSQLARQYTLGNTPAPKGHYIYNAFDVNRTAKTGISGLPTETAGRARPSACAFYAGRVWYAGVQAPKYSTKVFFSQLIERDDQFGKCYQINDPTSETTFDIIDTDGGTLDLPLIEEVVAMTTIKETLLIIGTNGIYSVRGTDTGPFRATNYVIDFVSTIGVDNHKALVEVDSGYLWWGNDAIYALTPDQVGLTFQVQNVSKATIQSLIDEVPSQNRRFIKGAFSKRDQIVRWIYSDDDELTGYKYNRVLEMNIQGPAFYTYTLDTTVGPTICGLIVVSGQGLGIVIEDVTTSTLEDVTTTTLEVIEVEQQVFTPRPEVFKFATGLPNGTFTYSEIWREELRDFITWGGVGASYTSYAVSGYRIRGELLRRFNTTPIVFVLRNTDEELSARVSGLWDYGERQSLLQELYYRFVPAAREYFTRRVKIRGKGTSLQLRIDSTDDKQFYILGWSTFDHGGTNP